MQYVCSCGEMLLTVQGPFVTVRNSVAVIHGGKVRRIFYCWGVHVRMCLTVVCGYMYIMYGSQYSGLSCVKLGRYKYALCNVIGMIGGIAIHIKIKNKNGYETSVLSVFCTPFYWNTLYISQCRLFFRCLSQKITTCRWGILGRIGRRGSRR